MKHVPVFPAHFFSLGKEMPLSPVSLEQFRDLLLFLSFPHFFFRIVIGLAFVKEILISYQKEITPVASHYPQGQVPTQSLPLTPTSHPLLLLVFLSEAGHKAHKYGEQRGDEYDKNVLYMYMEMS